MSISSAVLPAIASPRRREILRLVWAEEVSAGDIHRAMPDVSFGAVSLQLAYSTGTRWLSFGNDFRAFVRSYRPTGLTTVAWLRSYLSPKVYDVFARDDWLPLLVTICRYIKGLLCRLLRGIRRMARPLDAGTRHASERVEATKLTTK